jgi:hypothetical protein
MKTISAHIGLLLLASTALGGCRSTLPLTTPDTGTNTPTDGSGAFSDAGKPDARMGPPLSHRLQSTVCDTPDSSIVTSDATVSQDAGRYPTNADGGELSCNEDSECPACSNGQMDRCLGPLGGVCTCDLCNTDENCGATGVCSCNGQSFGFSRSNVGNICVPSNCRVDVDCGPGGFCSPTVDFSCGSFYGLAGYYCHTANDQCTNDSDCTQGDCRYSPQTGYWVCATGACAG